jgi:hypothetical protein
LHTTRGHEVAPNDNSAYDDALRSRGAVLAMRAYVEALRDRRAQDDAFWRAVEEFRRVNPHISSDEAKKAVTVLIRKYRDVKESL